MSPGTGGGIGTGADGLLDGDWLGFWVGLAYWKRIIESDEKKIRYISSVYSERDMSIAYRWIDCR